MLTGCAAAMFAGGTSHIPGGVGVFKTVVLVALPSSVPVDKAAAGLLLFRLIYYLVPSGMALITLALREVRMAGAMTVAHGMLRRVEGAFWLAIGALSAGIVASLLQGLDYERAFILALMVLVMLPCGCEFYRSA